MARYSIATAKDRFSNLIDKALAGEEVVITRHGKPVLVWHPVSDQSLNVDVKAEWLERLRKLRQGTPFSDVSYLDIKRLDEDEGLL